MDNGTALYHAEPGAVDLLRPGQHQYVVITIPDSGIAIAGSARSLPGNGTGTAGRPAAATRENWIDQNGSTWVRDTPADGSPVGYLRTMPYGYLNAPTPLQLQSLPTDGQALADYLNGHVHGSSSREEAFFTAISDIFKTHLPTADLRSALVTAAALNPSTTVDRATDPLGRPAVSISFIDETVGPDCVQAIYLDTATLEQIADSVGCADRTYLSTSELPTIVDSVPTAVTENAAPDQAAPSEVPTTFPDQGGQWTTSNQAPPTTG